MTEHRVPPPEDILDFGSRVSCFEHVIKHLYDKCERWDLCVEGLDIDSRRHEAKKRGCSSTTLEYRAFIPEERTCHDFVLGDHEAFMRPAYRRALESAIVSELYGWCEDRLGLVGDNGVIVWCRPRRVANQRGTMVLGIVSAYRVEPQGHRGVIRENRLFFEAAVRKLEEKTSFDEKGSRPWR